MNMQLFPKILIANRGEIAVRIIRTAGKMGITTVAVYAAGERDTLHVRMADEARELKGSSLAETYLNADQIISIARETGSPAIHPGYGFMSENENFAEACEKAGIIFIGPRSETIALMGNKTLARESAINAGLPVVEGYTGTVNELLLKGAGMKFPVLVKAAAGGGGKGMRIVHSKENLQDAIEATRREAEAYFGNGMVFLEQYIDSPRHIEVQLLADNHGNVIHLFERECSIQRRYQKIVEESPSPSVNDKMRKDLGDAALKLARAINYRNAGTIEFLADRHGNFYFLEMNTRIQVEHPATEFITNTDIVEEQIHIAAGHKLRIDLRDKGIDGHAIECRIYAEDPAAGFIPHPGKMTCYHQPEGKGVRVDSAYDHEDEVSGNYDPLISKLITHGKNREDAREKMVLALGNYGIHGIKTNISFLQSLMHNDDFKTASFSTTWCEENAGRIIEAENMIKSMNPWQVPAIGAIIASLERKTGRNLLWDNLGYWREEKKLRFCFEGEIVDATIIMVSGNDYQLILSGEEFTGKYNFENKRMKLEFKNEYYIVFISVNSEGQFRVTCRGFDYFFRRFDFLKKKEIFLPSKDETLSGSGAIYSPMPGRIVKVNESAGSVVKKGDTLLIIESMKMENSIKAPEDGIIESISVKEGELIDGSLPLILFQNNQTT